MEENITAFSSISGWIYLKYFQESVKKQGCPIEEGRCPNADMGECTRLSLQVALLLVIDLPLLTVVFHSSVTRDSI